MTSAIAFGPACFSRMGLRRVAALLVVISLSVPSCSPSLDRDLAGDWSVGPIPSGGGFWVTLATAGGSVSGTGHTQGVGPQGAITQFTVTGSQTDDSFVLTFTFASGTTSVYSGTIGDAAKISGTWTPTGGTSSQMTLFRCTTDGC